VAILYSAVFSIKLSSAVLAQQIFAPEIKMLLAIKKPLSRGFLLMYF